MLYIGNNNQMPNTDVLPSPRLMSTHLSYSLLPPSVKQLGCKVVSFYRDPKSTLISQWRLLDDLRGNNVEPLQLDKYVDLYASGVSLFGPAWDHIAEYTEAAKASTHVLRLRYEDMSENPVPNLKKLAEFMGVPFTKEEEKEGIIDDILKLCSFKNLSNLEVNKNGLYYSTGSINMTNDKFFRKGEVKEWANHMTPEMIEKLDKLAEEKFGNGRVDVA